MNYGSRTISLQVGIWNSTGHPHPGELSPGTDFPAPEPHVPNKGPREATTRLGRANVCEICFRSSPFTGCYLVKENSGRFRICFLTSKGGE